MIIPILNLTSPALVLLLLMLVVLCLFLARNLRSNTIPCILLLVFSTILVSHVIEYVCVYDFDISSLLRRCIAVDEVFVFVTFLGFLYTDRIQVEYNKANAKNKKGKKEKVIENDGLDFLFKKV